MGVGVGVAVTVAVTVAVAVGVGLVGEGVVLVGVEVVGVGVGAGESVAAGPRGGRTTRWMLVPEESSPVNNADRGRPVTSSNAVIATIARVNTSRATNVIRPQW